jgi:porin
MVRLWKPWRMFMGVLALTVTTTAVQSQTTEPAPAPPEAPAPTMPVFGGPWDTRPKLTGDWLGLRTDLAVSGVTVDVFWTQYSQGVTSGGRQNDWVYGGRGDYYLNIDGEKAGLWKGFFVTAHGETRYGSDVNRYAGTFMPVNFGMLVPQANTDITALTSLKFTQALSETFVTFVGKFNMLDELKLNFAAGRGVDAFMNTSLVFNPALARTVPYSTYGVGFAKLKDGEPIFTFIAVDPQENSTTGPTDLFGTGVVLLGQLTLPVKPFGLPGHQMFGATWSSRNYRAIDRSAFFFNPGEGLVAGQQSDSWALYYAFDQYLWVDPCNPKRGWGLFGQLGVSDANPNPIGWAASIGIGGNVPFRARPNDTFGIGYFYTGLSDDFKDLLNGPLVGQLLRQRDEQGVELFYNLAVTPYCHLTADLQVVAPSTRRFDTAVVPGARLKLDF